MLHVSNLDLNIGPTKILRKVNFKISPGETVGIIGPNGSGKTTLFNCLSGFLSLSSGSITFKNTDISYLPAHLRAKLGIGRVFQNSGVFKQMSIFENMLIAFERSESGSTLPWSKKHKERCERVHTHLQDIGLEKTANRKASSLSGGQLRLLEIARTLAFGAELFLLDEPTAGVSPRMKGEVEAMLQRLSSLHKTVLIIEHDMNFIQKLCSRILVMDEGSILLDDTPAAIKNNPLLQDIYFGNSA